MNTIFGSNTSLRFLAGLACLVVVVAGIREASGIITDIMVAIFVAISCAALLNWVALEIVIFGYIAINTAIGNFIEPRILARPLACRH